MSDEKPYPPIADYGIIGDCRCAALITREGAAEWLCLPDFHSPSVFASMLDREKGGFWRLAPRDIRNVRRRYVDDTNILETTYETAHGRLRVTDAMPVPIEGEEELQAEREIVRIAEVVSGVVDVELVYAPRPGYGAQAVTLQHRGKLGWSLDCDEGFYLLRSEIEMTQDTGEGGEGRLRGHEQLREGECRSFSLTYARRDAAVIPQLGDAALARIESTRAWWCNWSEERRGEGPFADQMMRSLLTLKLLQYSISGAVIAAATTSLPESIGHGRNWDYRFCWLRDASFMLRAFTDMGSLEEASAFFDWLMHATRITQPRLQTLYDVFGRTDQDERTLDHLDGYCGSRPVRVGNDAHDQLQLDIYGSVVGAARAYVDRGKALQPSERRLLTQLGDTVCDLWQQPDNGIWEFRGSLRHNTWSKVMCWAALNDLLHLDDCGAVSVPRARFTREREAIRESVLENAFDESRNTFVGAYGEGFLDATALLFPAVGFIDARDPRMSGTWDAIVDRLQHGNLIKRYDEGTDEQSGSEGAFVICSFWAVNYLAHAGRVEDARKRMRALLNYANDLGLMSEEVRTDDGRQLGNFPQAFSHSGLINAALAIAEAEGRSEGRERAERQKEPEEAPGAMQ